MAYFHAYLFIFYCYFVKSSILEITLIKLTNFFLSFCLQEIYTEYIKNVIRLISL